MSDAPDPEAVARQLRAIEDVARATPPASPTLLRVAEQVRRLSRWLLAEDDERRLSEAADTLDALSQSLGIDARGPATRFGWPADEDPDRRLVNARGRHPLVGTTHPVAPPIALRVEGDRTLGEVTFDVRFEGNHGWVHGGFVAAGFDIVAVQAVRFSGRSGPTGTLTVRFRAPTPIGVPLRYEGYYEGSEGRKLFASGRLLRCDDDSVTAEAEAIVVARE